MSFRSAGREGNVLDNASANVQTDEVHMVVTKDNYSLNNTIRILLKEDHLQLTYHSAFYAFRFLCGTVAL